MEAQSMRTWWACPSRASLEGKAWAGKVSGCDDLTRSGRHFGQDAVGSQAVVEHQKLCFVAQRHPDGSLKAEIWRISRSDNKVTQMDLTARNTKASGNSIALEGHPDRARFYTTYNLWEARRHTDQHIESRRADPLHVHIY